MKLHMHKEDAARLKDFSNLSCSVPHDHLLAAVHNCIEENGEAPFRSFTCLLVKAFLELLIHYL